MSRAINLGLHIDVVHPASVPALERTFCEELNNEPVEHRQIDDDGQAITFDMTAMAGDDLASVWLRRGISRETACRLLRKLADRIEHDGDTLLNLGPGGGGHFAANGDAVQDWPEDDGRLPEIL